LTHPLIRLVLTHPLIRGDEGGQHYNARISKQFCHFTDTTNVFFSVLRREAKVLVQTWAIGGSLKEKLNHGTNESDTTKSKCATIKWYVP